MYFEALCITYRSFVALVEAIRARAGSRRKPASLPWRALYTDSFIFFFCDFSQSSASVHTRACNSFMSASSRRGRNEACGSGPLLRWPCVMKPSNESLGEYVWICPYFLFRPDVAGNYRGAHALIFFVISFRIFLIALRCAQMWSLLPYLPLTPRGSSPYRGRRRVRVKGALLCNMRGSSGLVV